MKPRKLPPRPRLFSEGKKLLEKKDDGSVVVLAELPSEELASFLSKAPLLERTLNSSLVLLGIVWEQWPSDRFIDRLQKIETQLMHTLRVASGETFECQIEDCHFTAAPGAHYCEYDLRTTPYPEDLPCAVRHCEEDTAMELPELFLCEEHSEKYEEFCQRYPERQKISLETWLSRRAAGTLDQPEEPEEIVPGLPNEITRSGLPAGMDPGPIEEALFGGGRLRCTAGSCTKPRLEDRIWCQEHAKEVDRR